jgi:serine/threonine protein kinase
MYHNLCQHPSPSQTVEGLPKAALRELRALRLLEGHAHTVRLLDAFPQGPHLALVLEYLPSDLEQVTYRGFDRRNRRDKT